MNAFVRLTLIARLAIRARRAKRHPNATAIVGLTGQAQTAIAPEGTIFVRGELWPARSSAAAAPGETVRVIGMNGLTLVVDPDQNTRDNKV